MTVNPFALFAHWYEEAGSHPSIRDASAMILATADKNAVPSARAVLLKGFDEGGFVFFTNMESRKSNDLKENPQASLCFLWHPLGRQVRIDGKAEPVSNVEADAYFATRPFISRIGALASSQSRPLDSQEMLVKKVEELKKKYSDANPPPRPAYWSGWRVMPHAIEFWREGEFRLHDRTLYTREGTHWKTQKLYP